MDAVEVGNMITVLSNLGVMNIGAEKMVESTAANTVTIIRGFLHRRTKRSRLDESKSSPCSLSVFIR